MRGPFGNLLVLLVLLLPLGLLLSIRARLFALDVRDGHVVRARGRMPLRLLQDMREILALPKVGSVRLEARLEGGRPMLRARGTISDAQLQRLRNVLGTFQVVQLRSAPKVVIRRRT